MQVDPTLNPAQHNRYTQEPKFEVQPSSPNSEHKITKVTINRKALNQTKKQTTTQIQIDQLIKYPSTAASTSRPSVSQHHKRHPESNPKYPKHNSPWQAPTFKPKTSSSAKSTSTPNLPEIVTTQAYHAIHNQNQRNQKTIKLQPSPQSKSSNTVNQNNQLEDYKLTTQNSWSANQKPPKIHLKPQPPQEYHGTDPKQSN